MTEKVEELSRGEALARVAVLEAELAQKSLLVREMDLMFGRMLLGMRAAVIEEEHGKGAEAAMVWIFNGLVGPGELPPEEEKDAQAYFDREVKAIDEGIRQIMDERKALRTAPAPVERVEQEARRAGNLPCPFCGCDVDPKGWLRGDGVRGPECDNCGATAASLEAWNKRTTPQPAPTAAQDEPFDDEAGEQLPEVVEAIRAREESVSLVHGLKTALREIRRIAAHPPEDKAILDIADGALARAAPEG